MWVHPYKLDFMLMAQQLNPQQQQAVEHLAGPLLVLAGAGSGKTRIVTQRIVRLIEAGIPAREILAVTFTNKAAGEMRERVGKLTRESVLVSTFHSLGARLLREVISRIGYRTDFAIYDEEDSLRVLKVVAGELEVADKAADLKGYKGMISDAKNGLIAPEQAKPPGRSPLAEVFPKVYQRYQDRLRDYNAVDFDDLLFLPVQIFLQHQDILHRYQEMWRYLLVDEYQDTNEAQYRMVKLLAGERRNVFVVGDPDQSIYSWRGANINNILEFEKDFPGARVIRLEQNYRSTSHILQAANGLITCNESRYEKELWSDLGEGEKVKVYRAGNEYDEANFVVTRICKHHLDEGKSLNDMVIFYRTNSQSRQFEDALLSRRIPYVIVGGLSFYQRREVKDLIAFLRVVQSDNDFISFARTINLPKRGLGDATVEKLQAESQRRGEPIFTFCQKLVDDAALAKELRITPKLKAGLSDYVGIIRGLRAKESLVEVVRGAVEDTGYLRYLQEDEATFQDRKENVLELVSKAIQLDETGVENPLMVFLEELSLKSSLDEASRHQDHVKLMTLHNGKGLEFDIVFLVGMEEELLPHANSRGSAEALEEERRLCYVGMTRARRILYLSSAEERNIWGSHHVMRSSRFLFEIPPKHKETIGGFDSPDFVEEGEDLEDSGELFEEGDAVFHANHGIGQIERVYHGALGLTYEIYFHKDDTSRTLVANKTKLRRV